MFGSDLVHSRREVCKKLLNVLGGMDLRSVRLDWMMAWTMSEAGVNRGDGARRGWRDLEASCWMYWDALEQAI